MKLSAASSGDLDALHAVLLLAAVRLTEINLPEAGDACTW